MDLATLLRGLGENIRRARWAAGLTQEQVAAMGLTYRYYQEIERGQRNVTVETLLTIASILATTPAALLDVDREATAQAQERLEAADPQPVARGRKPRKAPARRR